MTSVEAGAGTNFEPKEVAMTDAENDAVIDTMTTAATTSKATVAGVDTRTDSRDVTTAAGITTDATIEKNDADHHRTKDDTIENLKDTGQTMTTTWVAAAAVVTVVDAADTLVPGTATETTTIITTTMTTDSIITNNNNSRTTTTSYYHSKHG